MSKSNISYKGKCLETNEWVFGFRVVDEKAGKVYILEPANQDEEGSTFFEYHEINKDTLCVSYGATDKKGNLVYTGDTLLGFMMDSAGFSKEPKHLRTKFVYEDYMYSDGDFGTQISLVTDIPAKYRYYCDLNETEVIGNIHD